MPYVKIKGYPKDEETKKIITKKITEVFETYWPCKKDVLSVSIEGIDPQNWEEDVVNKDIKDDMENMYLLNGEELK